MVLSYARAFVSNLRRASSSPVRGKEVKHFLEEACGALEILEAGANAGAGARRRPAFRRPCETSKAT